MNPSEPSEVSDITLWKTCNRCGLFVDACSCPGGHAQSDKNTSEPVILASGEIIGGVYQVIRRLGTGGMSTVYLCRHMLTDDLFAIKMLNLDISLDEEARKRFDREAMAMASLWHDNLVGLKGHGYSESGQTYFVMDFLDGKSLAAVLAKEGRLEQKRALKIFLQICRAMAHAHGAGIVHRDIKPGNIFLLDDSSGGDFVKVLDFGIAKLSRPPGESSITLTQHGQVLGSPRYMSPEQCLSGSLDYRSDIYSLGCVMYHVLAGVTPFDGAHSLAILFKQVNEEPRRISALFDGSELPRDKASLKDEIDAQETTQQITLNQLQHSSVPEVKISPELDAIIMKTLNKAPQDRYQSMEQLANDLQKMLLN
ncbi:MAG: serine/threonine protein kinase [Candidatus Obscuribacter sp.]|jgi:serine/threonine protein kinase|nr:serine/threonine protein kinase [Candidatus Obscuribacter sp.]MBK9204561.1 serine/threonine protein kinase [Candidatus Obscuribacter sp.]MBK9622309.1 serine/threonine protein kinase [Candidatus Obscuribacter sp.]MBK9773264.1 serine/threonine protein kinase [Candidatus Obscuribacter sp.]